MIDDLMIEPADTNPLQRLANKAARDIASKIEAGIAEALGKRLELGRPATEDDVKGIAHRMVALHLPEARWYYLDREPIFGYSTLKVVSKDSDWEWDGIHSVLSNKVTLECHSLPLEDAPPLPRDWPSATFQLDPPFPPERLTEPPPADA